jgi:uncharacterized protein
MGTTLGQLAQFRPALAQLLAELVGGHDNGGRARHPVPVIELLVIQPTPFCNINCSYCYLPDRRSRAMVSKETLSNLFAEVFASGWVRDCLSVVWHAGEPMVLPVEFYRDAFRTIAALKPAGVSTSHSFQTNGMLLDDAWCDFLLAEQVGIGVSIDGPRHLHDRHRLTRSGQGTFDRTLAGVRLLRRRGVPFHVISVLSSPSLKSPGEMFDFYVSEGIEEVCFNVEESEGDHVSATFAQHDVEAEFSRFMTEFWRRSAAAPGRMSFIREIDHAIRQVLRPQDAVTLNQLTEPFAVISMDVAGNISTFSPELLGLKNAEYGDFLLGNINTDRLADMLAHPNLARMRRDIAAGVELCRQHCQYFSVCGGGEPVNKLSENGSFVSTETTHCRLTRMRVTDLVLDAIDRLPASGSANTGFAGQARVPVLRDRLEM